MNNRINLLCDTNQMAYGSSSALLAILENLQSENTAFTWGVTKEILSSSLLIHHTIQADNKDREQIKKLVDLQRFDAVLVISNLTNINTYLDYGIPVFFVDLHYWYPAEKTHRVWKEAKKCFIERFFTKFSQISENSIEVGPIIAKPTINVNPVKNIIVNIGGGENRWIKPGENSNYLTLILEILNEFFNKFSAYKISIAAGQAAINSYNTKLLPSNVELHTFPQKEYLELLCKSEYLFTSPGLNAVFEGLYCRKKLVFLPPQNASQVLQLDFYERANLVKKGINLKEFYTYFRSLKETNLDEQQLSSEVLQALKYLEHDSFAKNTIIEHIRNQVQLVNSNKYFEGIEKLVDILGKPGSKMIADYIEGFIEDEKNR